METLRYFYHSDLSTWLSVDPMADQRSWGSSYSYYQNNPMNRIDPTGTNGSNSMYSWHDITSGNLYYEEDAFAGLPGGMQDFYNSSSQVPFRSPDKVQINQFMGLNRTHSNKGNRHHSLDVAFYRNDRTTGSSATDNDVSDNLNLQLFYSLKKFGLRSKSVFTATSVNSHTPYIPETTGLPNHHHFERFNNNVIPTLPTGTIRAYHPIIYSLTNMI